jgi:hypothetical protein
MHYLRLRYDMQVSEQLLLAVLMMEPEGSYVGRKWGLLQHQFRLNRRIVRKLLACCDGAKQMYFRGQAGLKLGNRIPKLLIDR